MLFVGHRCLLFATALLSFPAQGCHIRRHTSPLWRRLITSVHERRPILHDSARLSHRHDHEAKVMMRSSKAWSVHAHSRHLTNGLSHDVDHHLCPNNCRYLSCLRTFFYACSESACLYGSYLGQVSARYRGRHLKESILYMLVKKSFLCNEVW